MIIYPSESYVADQKCLEKKLNTYFELATQQQSVSKESIFADDGVPVFVSEADAAETYYYTVLPLIDFVCFEVFNQSTDTKDKALNLKPLITQWTNYVQAVRSHTSLYPAQCKWQKHSVEMNESQLALYNELESLLLTDDLRELDDIVRVSCGASVNTEGVRTTEFQLASKLVQNFSQLAHASKMLKQGENCAIEKAALEVKCEKLNADVSAIENIAAESKAQLQLLQKEAESLRENNLSQAQKLESLINEKQRSEEAYKNQLVEAERKLVKALEQKDNHIAELKKESELSQLQITQLQEELEALFGEKTEAEASFEQQKQAQEQKLAEALKKKDDSIAELKQENELSQLQITQLQEELESLFNENKKIEAQHKSELKLLKEELSQAAIERSNANNTAGNMAADFQAENELMQLQILQLQEELEFYFEKANSLQFNDAPLINATSENSVTSVAKHALENHNTLSLINRLMTEQGREK